jgi:hypothetical protein
MKLALILTSKIGQIFMRIGITLAQYESDRSEALVREAFIIGDLAKRDLDRGTPVCVIGRNIRDQLFAAHVALGQWVVAGIKKSS